VRDVPLPTRRRRERGVLVLLVAAYASLYLCRANIEPGFNMLALQYGYDNEQTGFVFATALAAYAVGKVLLGALGDVIGGKRILLVAMVTSVLATLLIGLLDWPNVVGKRTALGDYPVKNRGGKGVITIKTTTRNGDVSGVRIVTEEDHMILISDRGKLIRIRVKDVPVQGRATQGVRVMRVDDGEHVAAIERLAEPGEESGIAEGAPIEAVDETDTVPNEIMDEDEDEGGDEEPGDDDAGE
jgi:hypothetical protein